jgi:iron complex outermembrane recepter protein
MGSMFCGLDLHAVSSPRATTAFRRMARRSAVVIAVAAAIGLTGLAGSAWAQDQGASPPAAAGQDQNAQNGQSTGGVSQLQEVVVTAERRAENIQTTPIAVTAVTGDQLKANNITGIEALTQVAPALSVVNEGGYQLVMMRGVGNTLGEDPVTTGVPVILDNMFNPRGTGLDWVWFDIGDVETLRGPQGTLVGANSTGGAIVVNSAQPNFRGVNGYVTAQAGNYHDNMEEAAVNLPVSDTFAMRLAVHHEAENSFYSDQGVNRQQIANASQSMLDPGNMDQDAARVTFLWKPNDKFQMWFKVQYDENNTDGLPYNVNPNFFSHLPGLGCPFTTLPNGSCESEYYPYYSGKPWVLNYSTFTKMEYWDRFYSGDIRYTFNDGIVYHLYAGSEANQTPEVDATCACSGNFGYSEGGTGIGAEPDTNDYAQMELISPSTGKLNWIVGAAYIWSDGAFTDYSYTTGPAAPPFGLPTPADPTIAYIPAGETTREAGVYGNINWQFTRTLQLTAGLRGNWDNNFGTGTFNIYPAGLYTSCPTTPCIIPNNVPGTGIFTGKLVPPVYLNNFGTYQENHQTGKLGLNWTPINGQFFYVFYARGYKPGLTQFHAFTTTTPNAQAETLNDYELGWKGTFLGGRLTNQLGLYYDDYYDMQQNIFNSNYPNNGGISNVPHALIDGIEEALQMQIDRFGLNVSGAYTHSALSALRDVPTYEFPAGTAQSFGAFLPQCAPGVANNASCFNYQGYNLQLKGTQDPYAPEFTANVTVQYGFPIGEASLQPRVQFSYDSKQYSNILQNNDYYEMNQRDLWNAYLDFIDGRWLTTAYVTNLGNETYLTQNNGETVLYGPPRQYGLKTTFTF